MPTNNLYERGEEMDNLPEHVTRAEAAAYLRISLPTLGRRIKSGDIQAVKVGGLVRILSSSLRKLMIA